ncbi:hypothetical protein C3920_10295 [Novacetimonas pomaceti]|uniref:Uncharacterized protein n=1 Tax=Novacetimonas pomaceti TaxID=2021998 RepID=A0ABX5P0U7_9PROT|nr:hypothetical protein C3920_10295 [Novacetimonas pomaceti]
MRATSVRILTSGRVDHRRGIMATSHFAWVAWMSGHRVRHPDAAGTRRMMPARVMPRHFAGCRVIADGRGADGRGTAVCAPW